MERLVIYLLFVASGTAALMYEVLWVRILGLSLGVTVYATALVLMAYLGGLALGSVVWGRYIDGKKDSFLKKYSWLELAIGLSGLAVSLVSIQISKLTFLSLSYPILYPVVFCMLVLPTFFMGGTLPVMSKYLVVTDGRAGREAGTLYALNTIGGVVGCFGTGFFLIRACGVMQSMLVAVSVNVLVAIAAAVLARKARKKLLVAETRPVQNAISNDITRREPRLSQTQITMVLVLYGVSGFCSLGYEVLWTRALMFKIGNDTYAFSLMLGTFLLGLALGSFVFAKISQSARRTVIILGVLQLSIALTIAIGAGFLYRMDAVIDLLWLGMGQTWISAVAARFISAVLLMGIPTLCIGGMFPLVARLCSQSITTVGRSIGGLYSVNTVGTILGTGVVGFVLLPLFGIGHAMVALSMINVSLGAVFFLLPLGKKSAWPGLAAAVLIVPLVMILTKPKPLPLTAAHIERTHELYDLLYYREGVCATVSVVKNTQGDKMLNVNGVYTAFTTVGDLQVHELLGYLPYLFADAPRSALVIGLGLGVTSASLVSAGMHVDCVELAREEIGSAPFLAEYNDTILSKPAFRLIIDDGRHHLLSTAAKYDVITSNAVHVRTSPYLYTKDFYRLCRDRLNLGGAVCQWLPTNNIPEKEFKQLVSAFFAVFPHTSVWYVNPGHLLLLGTRDRLAVDWRQFEQRLLQQNMRASLRKVYLDNPAVVASMILMDEVGIARYVEAIRPHTDDRPSAEFVHVVESRTHDCLSIPEGFRASRIPLAEAACAGNGADSIELGRAFNATRLSEAAETAQWAGNLSGALDGYTKALTSYPSDSRTEFLRQTTVRRIIQILMQKAGSYLGASQFRKAIDEYSNALQVDTSLAEAYFGLGYCYYQLSDTGRAKPALMKAKNKGIKKDYLEIINRLTGQ